MAEHGKPLMKYDSIVIYWEDSKHLQEKLGELNVNVTRALQKPENPQ